MSITKSLNTRLKKVAKAKQLKSMTFEEYLILNKVKNPTNLDSFTYLRKCGVKLEDIVHMSRDSKNIVD